MPKLKANNIQLHYETYGQGQPLVFVAGFSADKLNWQLVTDLFAKYYQVIVFDNRGAGQSDCPDYAYSIEMMADDTIKLCRSLGLSNVNFVGNSMGGAIVQQIAYKYPSWVKAAVISNSFAKIDVKFAVFAQGKYQLITNNATSRSLIEISLPWAFSSHFLPQPGMVEDLITLRLKNPYPFTAVGYRNQLEALTQFDSSNWLHELKIPCLVMGSDQDMITDERSNRSLAENIPGAIFHCFHNTGHLPHIEQPEVFSEVVLKFLKKIEN